MDQQLFQQNIASTIGMDTLPEDEKLAVIDHAGSLILEAAVSRLIGTLSEEQSAALEHYMETQPTSDAFLEHLVKNHPAFSRMLTEEIDTYKQEVQEVLAQ